MYSDSYLHTSHRAKCVITDSVWRIFALACLLTEFSHKLGRKNHVLFEQGVTEFIQLTSQ